MVLGPPSRYVRRVMRGIRPGRESEEQYKERLLKMSSALQAMGSPMEVGTMEMLLAKASYDVMLYQASYDNPEDEVALLQQEYAAEMSEDERDRNGARIKALEQLLVERGVDLVTLRRAVGAELTPAPGTAPLPGPARAPGPVTRKPEAFFHRLGRRQDGERP